MTYLLLMWEFFKTGLFAVGGGLATLPFLREIAEKYDWFTVQELSDMLAVAESTPGPVGVNMATYAGYNAAFILGAIVATLSLVFPSVVILCIIAKFLKKYGESRLVNGIFYAIRPATVAIITAAIAGIFIESMFDTSLIGTGASFFEAVSLPSLGLFAFVLVGVLFAGKKVHPLVFIFMGAAAGILLKL